MSDHTSIITHASNVLGLQRHTVQVLPHHPDWLRLGEQACAEVQAACGPWLADVQHVGSTAVPHLPAKPVLDVTAAVPNATEAAAVLHALQLALASLGYLYRGDHGDNGGLLFLRESAPEVRTVHLHVVPQHSRQWQHYLQFRDALRHQPALRQRYAELKQMLAKQFAHDRMAYSASKHDFIQATLKQEAPTPPPA